MRRAESDLLNLGKVILHILIQAELSNLAERKLALGPAMGKIKDVDLLSLPQLFRLLWSHGLHTQIPLRKLATLDSLVEILLVCIWRAACGLFLRQKASALLRADVDLTVHPRALLVDEFEGVATVSVHMAPAIWDAAIAKRVHDLVNRFRILTEIFPKDGRVVTAAEMACGMSLLRMDQMRKLGGISDEENRCVVLHKVPVAFISAELDGEASWVTSMVMRTTFTTNSRKSDGNGTLFSFSGENVCKTEIVERIGGSVVAVGTTTLCMDNSLGDSFAIKV